jgi:hypothetical protein
VSKQTSFGNQEETDFVIKFVHWCWNRKVLVLKFCVVKEVLRSPHHLPQHGAKVELTHLSNTKEVSLQCPGKFLEMIDNIFTLHVVLR